MLKYNLLIIFILICSGCTSKQVSKTEDYYYKFTDSTSQKVTLQNKPTRVLALVGSYAETWLLAGGDLCGVTDDAIKENRTPENQNIQVVGSLHKPDIEKIIDLNPDFVILSSKIKGQMDIKDVLNEASIPVAYFSVENFNDYLNMLNICTDITGNKDLYKKNGLDIQEKIKEYLSNIDLNKKPTVIVLRASSNGIEVKRGDDNFVSYMLNQFNTINIADKYPSLLKDFSLETVVEQDPDYIFVTTMGDIDTANDALKNELLSSPIWSTLKAVKNNHYYVLPKELFQLKPNARWGESYEYLRKILY